VTAARVMTLSPTVTSISVAIRRDPSLSWVPSASDGWEASHVYLVRSPAGRLLVDVGAAAHLEPLRSALAGELEPGERVRVLLTRIELDCVGNLAALIGDGLVDDILSTQPFDVGDLLHLAPGVERVPARRLLAGWNAELQMEVCAAPLRSLATTWYWSPHSSSLWCSDAFGWAGTARAEDPPLLGADPGAGRNDAAAWAWARDMRPYLLAKFDWMARAEPERLKSVVESFFATHAPRMLLPTHGSVVIDDAAAQMISSLRAALAQGLTEPRPNADRAACDAGVGV
jgi:hypothetical protein